MVVVSAARLLRWFRLFLIVWFSPSCVSAARPFRWSRLFLVVRVVLVGFGRAVVAVISCFVCFPRRRLFHSRPVSAVSLFLVSSGVDLCVWVWGRKKRGSEKSGGEKSAAAKKVRRREKAAAAKVPSGKVPRLKRSSRAGIHRHSDP